MGRLATLVDPTEIARLWQLREKAVGRLGGGCQGVSFVEDTAVPPERLVAFVAEFCAILDGHGLRCGMFGHADVGCPHARLFMDLADPAQAAQAAQARRYGGLLWSEHGRGFRGEYFPFLFEPGPYDELQRIKAAFDPGNALNAGKLVAPPAGLEIDAVPLRGALNRAIPAGLAHAFDRATACNGNGACHSWNALDLLCPSYEATRDRPQFQNGRSVLLSGWICVAESDDRDGIGQAVKRSLDTCLSCKACTTLCPAKVDVPMMKSRFLERDHAGHPRLASHRLPPLIEPMFAAGRRALVLADRDSRQPVRSHRRYRGRQRQWRRRQDHRAQASRPD